MHMDHTLGGTTPFDRQSHLPHDASQAGNRGSTIERVESNQLHGHIASIVAENRELRAELEGLRAERARMAEILTRLMEATGSKAPERLVHDVRNILNERELYRALADSAM